MAREELLRKRSCLLTLANFTSDLDRSLRSRQRWGRSTGIVLLTYNRVGEGLLGFRTTKTGLTLDTYSGQLMTSITEEQMLSDEESGLPARLTSEQIADFLDQARVELSRRVLTLKEPSLFIVYAGEKEKFRLGLELVGRLSFLAVMAEKTALARFYLLTCNCDLAWKAGMAETLYSQGRVQTVVYNPGGACGGLGDLQTIAEAALNAVSEKDWGSGVKGVK